jgi:tetratricopeptide (TPR) repeat protein
LPHDLFLGIGIIHYNHTNDYEAARVAYERSVRLLATVKGHLFLGDTYWQLKQPAKAREHYREALLRDRTLVDAYRGYWAVRDEPRPRPSIPERLLLLRAPRNQWLRRLLRPVRGQLLRWRYEHHPEDERIHYMLGAHALVDRDFLLAEERLRFANELADDRDLEAQGRLALTIALQGRTDEAKKLLRKIGSTKLPTDIPANLRYDEPEERLEMIVKPFLEEPRLMFLPGADAFVAELESVFSAVWPKS